MGRVRYKVEWFDDNSQTCYMSRVVNGLLSAIAHGYNMFDKYKSCNLFKVYPVYTEEEKNEELAGKHKEIYIGGRDNTKSSSGFHYFAELRQPRYRIFVITATKFWHRAVKRDNNGNIVYEDAKRECKFIVAANQAVEAMTVLTEHIGIWDDAKINIYATKKYTNEKGIIDIPTKYDDCSYYDIGDSMIDGIYSINN